MKNLYNFSIRKIDTSLITYQLSLSGLIYIFTIESEFISTLSRTDRFREFKFKHCFRFIDDACSINDDNEFENSCKAIYPKDLHLKCEDTGNHATFLQLDITIKDGVLIYKTFRKARCFPI